MTRKLSLAYLGTWVFLAIFSVWHGRAIAAEQCFFQSNWFSCDAVGSTGHEILAVAILFALVGIWVVFSWHVWKTKTIDALFSNKIIALIFILAIFIVPFGSSDLSYYFWAGKSFASGNPYVLTWPMEKAFVYPVPHSDIVGFSYGPIIASAFKYLYLLSGGSLVVFMLLWKTFMAGAFAFVATLIKKVAASIGTTILPVALLLAQPLLIFEWIVNGHFDVLWIITVLAAVLAAHKRQWFWVPIFLVTGIWIKFIPLLILPIFVLWWISDCRKGEMAKKMKAGVIGAVFAGMITLFVWRPFWTGPQVFASVVIQSKWAVISVFASLYYSLLPLFTTLFHGNAHWYLTRFAQTLLVAVLVYFVYPYLKRWWNVLLGKEQWNTLDFVQSIVIFLLVYLFIWQKSFLPWYAGWFLPLGWFLLNEHSTRVQSILRWLAVAPFIYYIAWQIDWYLTGTDAGNELWFYYAVVGLVALRPLYLVWQWRKRGYKNV